MMKITVLYVCWQDKNIFYTYFNTSPSTLTRVSDLDIKGSLPDVMTESAAMTERNAVFICFE